MHKVQQRRKFHAFKVSKSAVHFHTGWGRNHSKPLQSNIYHLKRIATVHGESGPVLTQKKFQASWHKP